MAREFESGLEVVSALDKAITDALNSGEVESRVQEIFQGVLDEQVYEQYEPEKYKRREDEGGLRDKANIVVTVTGKEMTVEDVVTGNPKFEPYDKGRIDDNIEKGIYFYGVPGPRPFYQEADKEIDGDKQLDSAVEKQLNTLLE